MKDRAFIRVRHQTRLRVLEVEEVANLSRNMRRVVLGGRDLQGFSSSGFDDHVKLFFPAGGDMPVPSEEGPRFAGERPPARDFTPRAYDAASGRLTLDFAMHDAGPAADWAAAAVRGTTLVLGGPRGSMIAPTDFDGHLLIADETGLPAIGRRLEELPAAATGLVLALVDGPEDQFALPEHPGTRVLWVHRGTAARTDAAPLLAVLAALTLPQGDVFAWVAAESSVAREVRAHLLGRGLRREWVKASGYWRAGAISVHDKLDD